MMTINDWLRRTRSEDEEIAFPTFGFGTTSAAATAQSPSYSMNPSPTGEDSAAQGTRTTSQNFGTWGSPQSAKRELAPETDALDWMSRTTDEVDRATQNAIDRYNSPGNQQMLDNMTNRSRSADNFQDSRNRNNAQFSQALATQSQNNSANLQSRMTREQMAWAQDVALGGQPGDGRRRGSTSVSIEYNYSPFDTFMGNAAIIGNLGGFYSTQSNERLRERQLGLQAQGMEMDDRYRNRALAIDSLLRASQRSLWSSPLEQIALNQARQPGMARQ